ncbi:MAG: transglutaminase family protein [Verrucomicrobiota bacterium]
MKFEVQHRTSYVYESPVQDSFNEAYLCPVSDQFQLCHTFNLDITPSGASILRRLDFYTNQVHSFELVDPHEKLEVTARSTVETFADARDFSVTSCPSLLPDLQKDEWLYDFLHASERVPLSLMVIHEAKQVLGEYHDVQTAAERIMYFIHTGFTYAPGTTVVETPLSAVFLEREGVCQDFAHVMIALCRAAGIPARYVSGYFWMEESRAGASDDNTVSHAWVDCFLPGIGWAGFDPTHNRRTSEIYIKVAVGRDYSDVRPLSGTFRGSSNAEMDVAVEVTRIG